MNFQEIKYCVINANLTAADLLDIRKYGSENIYGIDQVAFQSIKHIKQSKFDCLAAMFN